MIRILASASALTAIALFTPEAIAQRTEPPLRYVLEHGDQKIPVELGREFELKADGTAKLTLQALPVRTFAYGGVQFDYLREFAFEADVDPESASWTMDGEVATVLILEIPGEEVAAHEIAESLAEYYEGQDHKYEDAKTKFGEVTLEGTRIEGLMSGMVLRQDVFSIPTEEGSRFLILQDFLEDDGKHSREFSQTLEMLQKTFRITKVEATTYVD